MFDVNLQELGFKFDEYYFTKIPYPFISTLLYTISIILLSPSKGKKSQKRGSSLLTFKNILIFLHNIILMVFSILCFINTAPIVYNLWREGWSDALCKNKFLDIEKWWFWTYLFYLSKYYEFVDTYILVWKGREPSFLQKFHHIGAVLGMWIIITTKSHTGYIFVVPNSFIHSIMYCYYALTVWKIKVPFKFIITRMQMIQFCCCLCLGVIEYYHWNCLKFADKLSLLWNSFYVPSLLLLFNIFYRKSYGKKKKKSKKN